MNHGLDTDEIICFYEQDFYPLSNFSSFTLQWKGIRFDTSEAAYHCEKFPGPDGKMARFLIRTAPSAHEAFRRAQLNREYRRPDWDDVKVDVMRKILRAKAAQHEYVLRKLLATGDRRLVENSWRDDFWGWGPSRDGQNMLGRLWMEIRSELRDGLGLPAASFVISAPAPSPDPSSPDPIAGEGTLASSGAEGRRGSIAGQETLAGSGAEGRRGSIAGQETLAGSGAEGRRGSIDRIP
jgi:ribA/ribD-fused uncharacterized protein